MPAEYNPEWKQTYPEPTVGALIYNDEGKVLLIRSSKWGERWHIPGGHVELGESCEDTVKREILEETGLEVDQVEYIGFQEANAPKMFHRKAHFIFLDYAVHMCGGELKISREMSEWVWEDPREALTNKKYKIDSFTAATINFYIKHFEDKNASNEVDELKINWQRALADYQNLQKEIVLRRAEWAQMSEQQILEEFIPVYEHLKLAINNDQTVGENNAWLDGVRHVLKQFADIFKAHNVEEIKTVGEKFDPRLHEAVGYEEVSGEKGDKITKEISAGFKMGDRVIKAARVLVGK